MANASLPARQQFAARLARRLGGRAYYDSYVDRLRVVNGTRFPLGSSGPIGEETPGRWQSFDEFRATLEHFRERREAGVRSIHWGRDSFSFWADIHMRA